MCLSIAYKNKIDDGLVLMKNVQKVEIDGDFVVLTDLMERVKKIEGNLAKVDMTDNYIIINTKD